MKKSVAITAIVALHATIIGTLLVQAGCSSEPEKPQAGTATASAEEIADTSTTAPADDPYTDLAEVTPPEGSDALRAAPTRPTWNMSGNSVNEVIVPDDEPETVEPVKPAAVVKPETPKSPATSSTEYVVKKGDSLSKIASAHGVKLGDLLAENNMNMKSVIRIGQKISIPGKSSAAKPVAEEVVSSNISEEAATYIVKKGDSLSRIAKNTGMTVRQIMEINGLSNHNIKIGQKLTIAKGAKKQAPAAQSASSAASPAAGEISYTVKSGDTLGAIAKKHGTSISAISERNNISDPRKIRVGQVIVIKSGKAPEKKAETAAPTTTTPAPKAENSIKADPTPSAPVVAPSAPSTTAPSVTAPAGTPSATTQAAPSEQVEELEILEEDIPVVEL